MHDLVVGQRPSPPELLKAYRERHGLTQAALADRLGISRALVGLLETGKKPFTLNTALRIEEELGIDLASLLPQLFKRGDATLPAAAE